MKGVNVDKLVPITLTVQSVKSDNIGLYIPSSTTCYICNNVKTFISYMDAVKIGDLLHIGDDEWALIVEDRNGLFVPVVTTFPGRSTLPLIFYGSECKTEFGFEYMEKALDIPGQCIRKWTRDTVTAGTKAIMVDATSTNVPTDPNIINRGFCILLK